MKKDGWTSIAALAVGILWAGGAAAGNLVPTNSPGSTMHTLEDIYQHLLTAQQEILANQRDLAELQQRLLAAGTMQQSSGEMVLIPQGAFVMGACTNVGQEADSDQIPQHTVSVSAFYMDKYEITGSLWQEVYMWATNRGYAFSNPGSSKGGTHPVQTINWYDCLAWCNARSQRDGFTPCYTNGNGTVYTDSVGNSFAGGCNWAAKGYRLPTEAEWEKAARGGAADIRFPWDDANTIQHARANYNAIPEGLAYDTSPTSGYHPTYNTDGTPYTSPVGSFAPNGYGLYDMMGNVWEWCWDWYNYDYYNTSPSVDPRGPDGGSPVRVRRGGSWLGTAHDGTCARRSNEYPNPIHESNTYGFRCVRKP